MFTTKPTDARVGVDGTAKFECAISGSPQPTSYWTHEGSGLLITAGHTWAGGRISVAHDNTLSIVGVREEDSGHYACAAVGEAGSAIARAHLEVQGKGCTGEYTESTLVLNEQVRDTFNRILMIQVCIRKSCMLVNPYHVCH